MLIRHPSVQVVLSEAIYYPHVSKTYHCVIPGTATVNSAQPSKRPAWVHKVKVNFRKNVWSSRSLVTIYYSTKCSISLSILTGKTSLQKLFWFSKHKTCHVTQGLAGVIWDWWVIYDWWVICHWQVSSVTGGCHVWQVGVICDWW